MSVGGSILVGMTVEVRLLFVLVPVDMSPPCYQLSYNGYAQYNQENADQKFHGQGEPVGDS